MPETLAGQVFKRADAGIRSPPRTVLTAAYAARLRLHGARRPKGRDVVLVQRPRAVRVAIDVREPEPRRELAADLLLDGVRKLHSVVVRFQGAALRLVCKRVEGQCVSERALRFVKKRS